MKRQPQRTCMGCNEKKDKKDLIRIVKNKNGTKRIERVFEQKISDEIYEKLRGVMLEK